MTSTPPMPRAISCCFTGHRPARLPWKRNEDDPRCLDLKDRLNQAVELAYRKGYRHFLCGMAQGSDLYFCEAVLALRQRRPGVTIEAAIPYAGQAQRWSKAARERWTHLVSLCDRTTILQEDYTRNCMYLRNQYLVDHASMIIAVYDGQPSGGTLHTLAYALHEALEPLVLLPVGELR